MRQAPMIFSRGAFVAALVVVVTFVVMGLGGSWLTLEKSGGSFTPVAAVPAGITTAAAREIEGLSLTLILSDDGAATTRRTETKRLESYGWVDRAHGVVHIPIDRAMRIVAGADR